MKKIFSLLLAGLMLTAVVACSDGATNGNDNLDDYKEEDVVITFEKKGTDTFYFEAEDSESVYITGFQTTNDKAHAVKIPAYLNGKKVIGIADGAFADKSAISSISFATVEEYTNGDADFSVAEFDFYIGKMAFKQCEMIKSVSIPSYVTDIQESAFYGCGALDRVSFADGSRLKKISASTFMKCNALIAIEIPASVTTIEEGAFQGCQKLASVVINEGTVVILKQAFQNCVALESVQLPASLTTIGKYAFHGSDSLYEGGIVYAGEAAEVLEYIASLNLEAAP